MYTDALKNSFPRNISLLNMLSPSAVTGQTTEKWCSFGLSSTCNYSRIVLRKINRLNLMQTNNLLQCGGGAGASSAIRHDNLY